ncbi:MAG: NAD(P)/FAD-dependent oxidoreductase [Fimbriimonadaceae bacterium]
MSSNYDVAIIGGGPAGSTCGSILKKYSPNLRVGIFEREKFPREHVGESQLPPIGAILDEMGCWEKVEKANFPLKIGATYRWGSSELLWDFEFVPLQNFVNPKRPGKFEGQRKQLAFQVNRAIYDQILLDHAQEMGCEVFQETKVSEVLRTGDHVDGLKLESGEVITATHYVDGSGGSGILRRAMGVETDTPTKLKNVAFWDYWENARWATKFYDTATRVLVLSIGSGWIWYIPLGPTTTSIGFICPAEFHKESGRTPKEQYEWALSQEPLVTDLIKGGSATGDVKATKDWSFVSERMAGGNWLLAGEAAGFADPILAAGLTLTHTSAREAAYTILAIENGDTEGDWLKEKYSENQAKRIRQHIRFADFWYSANGIFTDLQAHTTKIAAEAGLELEPAKAFQWLGTGGFTDDVFGQVGLGGLDLAGARQVAARFLDADVKWQLNRVNVLRLNLEGATEETAPSYSNGKIHRRLAYRRGNKILPNAGLFARVIEALKSSKDIGTIFNTVTHGLTKSEGRPHSEATLQLMQVMELMLQDGWITGKFDPSKPAISLQTPREGAIIHESLDLNATIKELLEKTS